MKKRLISIAISAILLLILTMSSAADSNIADSMDFQGVAAALSLDDAISIMLKDNPTIKQAQLDLGQAKVDYDKALKARKREKQILESTDVYNGVMKYPEDIKIIDLTIDFTEENAQRTYDATVEGLKADIERSYYELQQAEKLTQIDLDNLQIAKDLYEKAQKKFELGMVAKQEVLSSEMNYINAENDYKAAVNTFKAAKMSFNAKLGYDVMKDYKLKDGLSYSEYKLGSIREAVEKALVTRYEIKAAEYKSQIEDLNMALAVKKYISNSPQYKEQVIKQLKAQKDLNDTKKNIEMEVRNNYLQIGQKYDEIKAGEKSVELAQEGLQISQATYDAGMGLSTDVQKAQLTLQQARLGLTKAILDYNLAIKKYEDSIGVGRK